MTAALSERKGPAATAIAPDHGSTKSLEDRMNARSNITRVPVASKPADGDLQKAIYQYQASWYAYLATSLDDDNAPRVYAPALKVLEEWSEPATGKMDAAGALRLAIEFYEIGDSEVIPAMMKAALGFLEGSRS